MSTRCPVCQGVVLSGVIDGKPGRACIHCTASYGPVDAPEGKVSSPGNGAATAGTVVQRKLFGRGKRQNRVRWTEAETETAVATGCALRGWTVLSTSRRMRRHKCSKCGFSEWPRGDDGCSKGLPDRFVALGGGLFAGVELKGSDTALSESQRDLRDAGFISVARSWDEFEKIVQGALERVGKDTQCQHP